VDAQGRGRADNIDPADQWVLNPDTGEYELRLSDSAPQSTVPSPRSARRAEGAARSRTATPGRRGAPEAPGRDVPPQRRRRATPEEPAPGRRGRRTAKKPKAKKIAMWTGGTMALVLVAVAGGGYLYLKHLEGNVDTTDIGTAGSSHFRKDEAFNILLIGTDKRTGKGNESYGDRENTTGHADTTLLLHVAKDRTNATVLSIPRDMKVNIPDCDTKQADGSFTTIPGAEFERFGYSLGVSGRDAGCTMRTVQELTGIKPDHFMMADFNAIKTLTTAVDGVEVCVEKPVNDEKSGLVLPEGTSKIEGEQALAFVRTRHAWGNQGDLDRIKVQQQFLASLMRKMSSGDTLTSPTKLVKLAEAATEALTVDKAIGKVGTLKDIALEMKKVPPKNISFTTVPVKDNPYETVKVTVVPDEVKAPPIFDAIKNDVSFTEVKQKQRQEKAAVAARLKGPKAPASEVRVQILNGSGKDGAAQQTLNWLQLQEGVSKSENGGNAPADLARTTLEYAPDQADQARALAAIMGLPGAAMKPGESVINAQGMPTMTLTLGKDFKGAGIPLTGPAKIDVDKSTADKVQCAG
jgi:LCP family protein required for cell wall assembly